MDFTTAANETSAHNYGVLLARYGSRLTDSLPLAAANITDAGDGSFVWGGEICAVLVPVWIEGELADVVAFDVERPTHMLRESCRVPRLFGDGFEPVAVWPTADEWLRRGCVGQVLLDRKFAWELYGGAWLQVEDPKFAQQLDKWCRPPKFRDARITVQPYAWPQRIAA